MNINSETSRRRNVLIYRHDLLHYSETFILNQGEALEEFLAWYVGCRRVEGLTMPPDRTLVLRRDESHPTWGVSREWLFKATGYSPLLRAQTRLLSPALVHAHFAFNALPALSLSRYLGVPLIVTVHGADATIRDECLAGFAQRVYVARRSALAKGVSLVIAVSHFLRDRLLDQGFPPEKVIVHRIGIDRTSFFPDPSITRRPTVLFVGRLVEKKGCKYLLAAMESVKVLSPDVELVVIGEGPLRAQLESQASEAGVAARFLGAQPPSIVRDYMRKARILAVPSVTASNGDSEGLGMVCLEAQAMRLPVVGFATGGIPEAVVHGETGLLSPAEGVANLAANLSTVLRDEALADRMGRAGEENVRRRFDLHSQTGKLEEIYAQLAR